MAGRGGTRQTGISPGRNEGTDAAPGPEVGAGGSFHPDPSQTRVIEHGRGPLIAVGGPGTGKTTALEERYVQLATRDDCAPDRVLFLVGNRGQKMLLQDRITRRLLFEEGLPALVEVPIYTWHGLAHHLVTRHYDRLAYPEPPVLLTSPEQWGAIRDALAGENPTNWPHHHHLLRNRGFVDEVVDFVIRAEQRLMEEADLARVVQERPAWEGLVRFFKKHRDQMRSRSRVDYPTLLRDSVELVANHDDVREGLHKRFLHVLVDDGQELSFVQQRLLHFLSGGEGRSLVVSADPDSSIEHFRGADPAWLGTFEKDFGPHEEVFLKTSYRLGEDLASRAGRLVAKTEDAAHRPDRFEGGSGLEVRRFQNVATEVDAVARDLRISHLRDGVPYEDMAILLSSPRSMLPALERALRSVEVPFAISAPDRPLEREGVIHAFCELARYAYADAPDDDHLAELLSSPLIGLETVELRELERSARTDGVSLSRVVVDRSSGADADGRLSHLIDLVDRLRRTRTGPADGSFWTVWESSHHYAELVRRAKEAADDPAHRDLDALVAFSKALGRFVERRKGNATLEEYLEGIGRADFGADPWLPPERRRPRAVQVLSFHGAKGKEWDVVAVCGVVEGAIPKGRRAQGLFDPYFLDGADVLERERRNEAEDRRVLYVALTRARSRCLLTASPGPTRKGQPSRYVSELVDELPQAERTTEIPPLTYSEAAARSRRVLSDPVHAPGERVAALATILRICEMDPGCAAAQPASWWWRWDWTEGSISLNDQVYREEGMPPDKLRTSYSRLSNYDNCPLQYLCGVVLGLDPEVTHNLAFGRWIHEVIEDCEKDPTEEQQRLGRRRLTNPDMVFRRYEEIFDETVFPNSQIARQFRHDGRVMLQNYMRYGDPGKAAVSEHAFRVDIDGHVIRGRIDRVDKKGNNLIVGDYKTSRYEAGYEEARQSLQLAFYYKASLEDPELSKLGKPVSMQLIYPAKVARGDMSRRSQKPEEAEEVLERLPGLLEGVLAEDFAPSPEANCRWCRFKPLCPLWSEGKELQP